MIVENSLSRWEFYCGKKRKHRIQANRSISAIYCHPWRILLLGTCSIRALLYLANHQQADYIIAHKYKCYMTPIQGFYLNVILHSFPSFGTLKKGTNPVGISNKTKLRILTRVHHKETQTSKVFSSSFGKANILKQTLIGKKRVAIVIKSKMGWMGYLWCVSDTNKLIYIYHAFFFSLFFADKLDKIIWIVLMKYKKHKQTIYIFMKRSAIRTGFPYISASIINFLRNKKKTRVKTKIHVRICDFMDLMSYDNDYRWRYKYWVRPLHDEVDTQKWAQNKSSSHSPKP